MLSPLTGVVLLTVSVLMLLLLGLLFTTIRRPVDGYDRFGDDDD